MQLSSSLIFILAAVLLANALPRIQRDDTDAPASTCINPPVQCCENWVPADNPVIAPNLAAEGIVPKDPSLLAVIGCTPVEGTVGPGGNVTW